MGWYGSVAARSPFDYIAGELSAVLAGGTADIRANPDSPGAVAHGQQLHGTAAGIGEGRDV